MTTKHQIATILGSLLGADHARTDAFDKAVEQLAALMQHPRPAFETERLRVFAFDTNDNGVNTPRHVFVAFFRQIDWPGHVCTATVSPFCEVFAGCYVDWIETTEAKRREGIARELCIGIEKYLGRRLVLDAVTEAGEAFAEHMVTAPRSAA